MEPISLTDKRRRYWRRTLRMTLVLLAIWFVVTFGVSFFARQLVTITIFGFPFGFYMGAQGALVVYALIVGIYARYMNRLDREYGVRDGDE
jgi:putative solute:sodium symporter small subunit